MNVLSGGAAAAVVKAVAPEFERATGTCIDGTFNAVGVMRDELLAGTPCDLLILTKPLIAQLIASGHVVAGSAQSLGLVKTGVAVPAGASHPPIGNRDELASALRSAPAIYFPDPDRATAGIHFMNVLKALGLDQQLASALRRFPNGATAMGELAKCGADARAIGCTQITEINYTDGVELVGALPLEFELATDYTLGICSNAENLENARLLAQLLVGSASEEVRRRGGFTS